jgi:hypothetical protein
VEEIKGGRLVFWVLKEKTEDTYQPRTVDAASRTLALRCAGFGLLHRDLINMA